MGETVEWMSSGKGLGTGEKDSSSSSLLLFPLHRLVLAVGTFALSKGMIAGPLTLPLPLWKAFSTTRRLEVQCSPSSALFISVMQAG